MVQLSGLNRAAFGAFVRSLEPYAGAPHVVSETQILFTPLPKGTRVVLVPLTETIDAKITEAFSRFVDAGGELVLIPPATYPDASVLRLFQKVGLPVTGSTFSTEPVSLRWKGDMNASVDRLGVGSMMLTLQPTATQTVRATWGRDYPALVSTPQGALLNWPMAKSLAPETRERVLRTVLPLPERAQLAAKSAPSDQVNPSVDKTPEKKASAPTFQSNPSQPAPSRNAGVAASEKARPLAPLFSPNPVFANTQPTSKQGEKSLSAEKLAVSKPAAVESDSKADEVLDAILGQDGEKSEAGVGKQPKQPFSFLDPEAWETLQPEFDYGTYSYNMRMLDDYRTRTESALKLAEALALEIPGAKVRELMDRTQDSKRQFERLYLGNETLRGLDAFKEAKKTAVQALALATASPAVEGRAIWLDRSTIVDAGSPEGMRALMKRMHEAGINIVYFETLNAGFPIYPSKVTPHNPMVNGWDPLKIAVDEGHRLGMEVHAWVWCFAVGNRRHNPLINKPDEYAGPILTEAGMMSEALRNSSGGLSVDSRQHEFWLSPASPKAREYLLGIYREIVTNYDVDGLQLDYIRYPFQANATRMGFEPVGRQRFFEATGVSLDELDDYKTKIWIAWKTYQVNSFVQEVSDTLRAIKPNIKLSAAVFPMARQSRIVAIQQDWETWVDNGWIDTLSPMSYTSDPEKLQSLYETVRRSPQKNMLIYPGVAMSKLDAGELVMELEALREKGSLGATLFAGAHLDPEKAAILGTGPYKRQQTLPPHRDVVQSLQVLTKNYGEKFERIQGDASTPRSKAIKTDLTALSASLNELGSGRNPRVCSPVQVQEASRRLASLGGNVRVWLTEDQADKPYLAIYFEQNLQLLNELMGYLADLAGTKTPTLAESK